MLVRFIVRGVCMLPIRTNPHVSIACTGVLSPSTPSQIRSSVSAPPRLSVSPQKSKSSHGKPPRSSAPEPAELDAKKLVAGALRTWIAKRELDQVEARKVFEKINNALKR